MVAYDEEFYRDLDRTAEPSARCVLPLVRALVPIASAVDVGCGDGGWLAALRALGVEDVLGIDGPWVGMDQLKRPVANFRRATLDRPFGIGRRFDLALSLEVAEHLPASRAAPFVAELVALAPVVLFSAAIPGQGGVNHVNEQWPAYWAGLFASHAYRTIDCLRLRLWDEADVTWWYKQNLLLFADTTTVETNPALLAAAAAGPAVPPGLVHPECFATALKAGAPPLGRWLGMAPGVLGRMVRRRGG